ncbi:MAG: hypothetical protein ACRC2J_16755 [Microcoleaceae cyanobacterium]
MSPQELNNIIPQAPQPASAILQVQQVTQEFYREVESRQEFVKYCQWYYETAAKHRQELNTMRSDINILSWFLGTR